MKKMMILTMMVTIATHVAAMSYNEVKAEALFLTDKMAYELRLDNEQYEAVYEINFDYIAALDRHDIFGNCWSLRNVRLRHVLNSWQFDRYQMAEYFYRPVSWTAGTWHFSIYHRYTDRHHFYRPRPNAFTHYHGHVGPAPRPNPHPGHHNGSVTPRPNPHHGNGTGHGPGNGSVTPRPNPHHGNGTGHGPGNGNVTPRPNTNHGNGHGSGNGHGNGNGHFGGRK